MTNFNRFKSVILMAVLFTFFFAEHTQAEEYKWLKTPRYQKIFVYTDVENCDFMADKLNETIKRTLTRYKITATISDSLAFQTSVKGGNSVREVIDDDLTADNHYAHIMVGR